MVETVGKEDPVELNSNLVLQNGLRSVVSAGDPKFTFEIPLFSMVFS